MPETIPERFDILRPEGRQGNRFDEAISALRDGVGVGEIRKVVFDDLKNVLGRATDKAWERTVSAPFFHAGKFRDQPGEVYRLYSSINMSSLHDCLSTRKKIDRSGLTGQVVDAMNAVLAEALPLSEAMRDLKGHVILGRAPNPNPVPQNPDKEIGTCSCCMRGIAVVGGGNMAHHGYQRPGTGEQTASCAGIRFPPLEVSTEGLDWLIGVTNDRLARLSVRLGQVDNLTEIRWSERDRKTPSGIVQRICGIDDPEWGRVKRRYILNLEADVRGVQVHLSLLDETIVRWRAFHDAKDLDEGMSP